MPRTKKEKVEEEQETPLERLPSVQRAAVHIRGMKPLLMSSPQEVYAVA